MMRIPLDGEANCRDLGGYVGQDGRFVRKGYLFRSGHLSHLTDADMTVLKDLGIRHIVDLRTDVERKAKPNRIPLDIVEHHLPLLADLGASSLDALFQDILNGSVSAEKYMCDIYRTFDETKMDSWRKFFKLLLEGAPILWNCTAGKDRTGMTAAILLRALGATREIIVADYMLTNEYSAKSVASLIGHFREQHGEAMAEKLRDLVIVKPLYMDTFFCAIEERFGSWNALFKELEIQRQELCELYLEPMLTNRAPESL